MLHGTKQACNNIAAPADVYGCGIAAPRWVETSGRAAPGGGFAAPGSFTHAIANAPSTCASCGVWDVSALCGICGHTLCAQCIACGFYCMCNEMNLMFCSSCGTETSSMAAHSGMQDRNPEPALLGGGLGTDGNETCAFKTACIKSPQKNFWDSNLT